jgi:hypothetical protein
MANAEGQMNDFEWEGSFAAFIAREKSRGTAVRVSDKTMEPVLMKDDMVRVEKKPPAEGTIVCVQVGDTYVFGYFEGNLLERENGPAVRLVGTERVLGVVTAVVDRDLRQRR